MPNVMLVAAAVALCLIGGPVFAHAFLATATPPVGGTVQTAPPRVTIEFTEGVEPAFSTIEVTSAAGARVDSGAARSAPGDDKRLSVALKPLGAGTYTVVWHAISVDTHKTQGRFTFSVGS